MNKEYILEEFNAHALSVTGKRNENEIQGFLDRNTELIPTPFLLNHGLHFNFIFSKLSISDSLVCDYAYLTKSSVKWVMVLLELEASNKSIFTKSNKNIAFSAEFNNAYDQVLSWNAYLESHKEEFKNKFGTLMGHMGKNPFSIKCALIIGRSSDIDTQEKSAMVAQKQTDEIQILTYDSVIRIFKRQKRHPKNLVTKVKNGYELRSFVNFTSAFAYLKPGNFSFNSDIEAKLVEEGFDIPSWKKGDLLSVNGKQTLKTFGNVRNNNQFMTEEFED